jgi:predicted metal-dependent phosphoesterase TrpH
MRCDLHVHSRFSGRCTVPVLRHFIDESYSEPEEVYARARSRGMDLVTLTDHDTIEGAQALAGRPDTFVSEEVTCGLPGGRQLHLGVYDLSEDQHEGIAARRDDAERLFAYLAEQRLPVSLNHPFSALTGERRTHDLDVAFARFDLVEGRNSMLPPVTNRAAAEAALSRGHSLVGGSDSHTLHSVARAYTVVPGARTREEFLAGLRQGFTLPAGDSGTYARFAGDLVRIAGTAYREAFARLNAPLATAALLVASAPLLPLLPLVAAGLYLHERSFAARHFEKFRDGGDVSRRPRRLSGTLQAAPSGA